MKRQLPLVVYITGGTINLKFVFYKKILKNHKKFIGFYIQFVFSFTLGNSA